MAQPLVPIVALLLVAGFAGCVSSNPQDDSSRPSLETWSGIPFRELSGGTLQLEGLTHPNGFRLTQEVDATLLVENATFMGHDMPGSIAVFAREAYEQAGGPCSILAPVLAPRLALDGRLAPGDYVIASTSFMAGGTLQLGSGPAYAPMIAPGAGGFGGHSSSAPITAVGFNERFTQTYDDLYFVHFFGYVKPGPAEISSGETLEINGGECFRASSDVTGTPRFLDAWLRASGETEFFFGSDALGGPNETGAGLSKSHWTFSGAGD